MRAPDFWARQDSVAMRALTPLAAFWTWGARRRQRRGRPRSCGVPVLCVGNLVLGGSGKTPVVLALAERLQNSGIEVHILSHGYRGRLKGPVRVDPRRHTVGDVGDEALVAARTAPTWVARDRVEGGAAIAAAGADCLVLDDGFQDPALAKDLAFLVFDGGLGVGNGRTLPAGPLREPSDDGFRRAHAAVLVGEDTVNVRAVLPATLPCIRASMRPAPELDALRNRRVFAFAGIGRPEKFFRSLRDLGADVVGTRPFPDHHRYRPRDLEQVLEAARAAAAVPVTTTKDEVRLPGEFAARVMVAEVRVRFDDGGALDELLARVVGARKPG